MSDLVWILWVVLGVILIVAEIFTSGFVLLWFGAGAIAAALAALAGRATRFQFPHLLRRLDCPDRRLAHDLHEVSHAPCGRGRL
jgi:hypothetical protein